MWVNLPEDVNWPGLRAHLVRRDSRETPCEASFTLCPVQVCVTCVSEWIDRSVYLFCVSFTSDQYRAAPFTSFSVLVCHMVKEMHRRLLLMMSAETSAFVMTQSLKCLATLMANVPYQRLRPGLLSCAVKQIRPFLSHRGQSWVRAVVRLEVTTFRTAFVLFLWRELRVVSLKFNCTGCWCAFNLLVQINVIFNVWALLSSFFIRCLATRSCLLKSVFKCCVCSWLRKLWNVSPVHWCSIPQWWVM